MTTTETKTNEAIGYWNSKAGFFASEEPRKRNRRMTDLYETSCWRYIEPLLPPIKGGKILEAGCGTGRWVYRLAPMGYNLTLLDFSEEMIRHAESEVNQLGLNKNVTGFHVQDICHMDALPENCFDLILALGMPLSLCSDPDQAVAEIFRITKPGGYVVCDTMNRLRTALDMARKNNIPQLINAITVGRILTESGQTHNCFSPQELETLFINRKFRHCQTAAITPFFEVPPSKEQVKILDDDNMFRQINNLFQAVAEDPGVIGLSSRLLIVAQKYDSESNPLLS